MSELPTLPNGRDPIYAKVIADSISPDGVRLTTWEKCHHRWVLAEENTHATPAKNSGSSRARPIGKVIEDVRTRPAIPVVWASEKRGMQGGEPVSDEVAAVARVKWDKHREATIALGFELRELGVHKSITNRLLEPHMMHVSVWTATAIENYFDQRVHPDAQAEIEAVARLMRDARNASVPVEIGPGEFHLPYIRDEDREQVKFHAAEKVSGDPVAELVHAIGPEQTLARISAGRVARTSYLTHDGRRDLSEDLRLYRDLADNRLAANEPPHWSPLEQVATPCPENRQEAPLALPGGSTYPTSHLPKVGKFTGWLSMRHVVEAENQMATYR